METQQEKKQVILRELKHYVKFIIEDNPEFLKELRFFLKEKSDFTFESIRHTKDYCDILNKDEVLKEIDTCFYWLYEYYRCNENKNLLCLELVWVLASIINNK